MTGTSSSENDTDAIETPTTTDKWPTKKILKHVLLPKPKGSPKAGKKEIGIRIVLALFFLLVVISVT